MTIPAVACSMSSDMSYVNICKASSAPSPSTHPKRDSHNIVDEAESKKLAMANSGINSEARQVSKTRYTQSQIVK